MNREDTLTCMMIIIISIILAFVAYKGIDYSLDPDTRKMECTESGGKWIIAISTDGVKTYFCIPK